jgi:DNA-binding GntR family transcriptional regulator
MSTVPIREAIRRLEAEGYVTFRHNVGAEVASVDLRRYADTMGAVAIIEAAATGLSAEHLGADDIQRLRDINAALVESLESFDPMRFTHYNHEFHSVIFSKCPNTYLIALLEREWALLSSVRRSSFAFVPKRAREAAMEHAHLIELIENKASPEEIESYARSHRMATVDALLRQLTEEADRPL